METGIHQGIDHYTWLCRGDEVYLWPVCPNEADGELPDTIIAVEIFDANRAYLFCLLQSTAICLGYMSVFLLSIVSMWLCYLDEVESQTPKSIELKQNVTRRHTCCFNLRFGTT